MSWLLVFVPIAIALEWLAPERHLLVFFASALAILPLAGWMGRATEQLATRLGEGVGGLLNATFGNFPEFIIVLMAGVLGYVMKLLKFPMLPLVLGLMLGYMVEANFRRSLMVSSGDPIIFFQDPISLGLLVLSGLMIFGSAIWPALKKLYRQKMAAS